MSDKELKVQDAFVNSLINHYETVINQYKTEIEQLKSMSSINPQKTAEWIANLGIIWCSNCNYGIDVRVWHRSHYNYCPNCGCRMAKL